MESGEQNQFAVSARCGAMQLLIEVTQQQDGVPFRGHALEALPQRGTSSFEVMQWTGFVREMNGDDGQGTVVQRMAKLDSQVGVANCGRRPSREIIRVKGECQRAMTSGWPSEQHSIAV